MFLWIPCSSILIFFFAGYIGFKWILSIFCFIICLTSLSYQRVSWYEIIIILSVDLDFSCASWGPNYETVLIFVCTHVWTCLVHKREFSKTFSSTYFNGCCSKHTYTYNFYCIFVGHKRGIRMHLFFHNALPISSSTENLHYTRTN